MLIHIGQKRREVSTKREKQCMNFVESFDHLKLKFEAIELL